MAEAVGLGKQPGTPQRTQPQPRLGRLWCQQLQPGTGAATLQPPLVPASSSLFQGTQRPTWPHRIACSPLRPAPLFSQTRILVVLAF